MGYYFKRSNMLQMLVNVAAQIVFACISAGIYKKTLQSVFRLRNTVKTGNKKLSSLLLHDCLIDSHLVELRCQCPQHGVQVST